jgi:tetratricopeptide (TPR) repeat protein
MQLNNLYKIFIIKILFILSFLLPLKKSNAVDIIDDGLTDIYNLKFNEAEQKFKSRQYSNPGDIKGFFYESLIYFYKAMATRSENDYEKFLDLSSNVIDRADDMLDRNDKNYDAIFYKGLSYSYRSLLMLSLNKNLLRAASNGNDGYRLLNNLLKSKPDYYDAYMGLGLYKIVLGYVPEKFQWLLSIIGFDGNIRDGKTMLQTSMQRGRYTKTDSKAFLTIFSMNEREEDDQTALKYSEELANDFPGSPVFKIYFAALSLQAGNIDNAIEAANEGLELNNNSLQNEIKKAAFATLGTAYFRLNDFEKAITFYEDYMKLVNEEDRYNVYLFTLGTAYELTGRRNIALQKYRNARDKFINERDGDEEKFFYRYAQERIKTPYSRTDSLLITGLNLKGAGRYDDTIEFYNEVMSRGTGSFSDDDKAKMYLDLSQSYIMTDNIQEALKYLNYTIALKPGTEKWIIPHAYFELGKIYSRQGDNKKANEMFEKIFDYGDYDFRQFLEMRLANYKNK